MGGIHPCCQLRLEPSAAPNVHLYTNCKPIADMSSVVSVRVPWRLKKEMEKLKNVDWPALLKSAIEERLRREKLKAVWKDVEELRTKIPPSPEPDFSTNSIRQDRVQC